MAEVGVDLQATPEQIFDLLSDPRCIPDFVVGSRAVRRFDATWPAAHSKIHHTVGFGPLLLRDSSEVMSVEPGRNLVIEARVRPLGKLEVEFDLAPNDCGTRLTVREKPVAGPMALGWLGRLTDLLLVVRNREMTRRLSHLVNRRNQARSFGWAQRLPAGGSSSGPAPDKAR